MCKNTQIYVRNLHMYEIYVRNLCTNLCTKSKYVPIYVRPGGKSRKVPFESSWFLYVTLYSNKYAAVPLKIKLFTVKHVRYD